MSDNAKDKNKEIREWIQIAIIIFAGAWTSYEFFFKEFIKPAHEPTALELDVKLEHAGEKDGFIMVKGTIKAVNPTSRRIYVPAFWYTVKGHRLSMSRERAAEQAAIESLLQHTPVRNYVPVSFSGTVAEEVIHSGQYAFWDPKDKTSDEVSFAVPKDEFDFLDMNVLYIHTRDNEELLAPEWRRNADGSLDAVFKFKEEKTEEEDAEWHQDNGAGFNWARATLSLWEKPKDKE